MTQLEYYTMLLRAIAVFGAYTFGVVALGAFAVLPYCFHPFLKK